ncbi:unnamed protein product, partial [Candidula unifasciata]
MQYTLYLTVQLQLAELGWHLDFLMTPKMTDDDVIGCASNTSGYAVKFSANNKGHFPPTLYTDTEVTLTSYSSQNGIYSCTIQRPVSASANGRVDANTAWTLLFAAGSTTFTQTGEPTISYHGGNRFWSTVPVKVTDTSNA